MSLVSGKFGESWVQIVADGFVLFFFVEKAICKMHNKQTIQNISLKTIAISLNEYYLNWFFFYDLNNDIF